MSATTERTTYLAGLILALLVITYVFGMPSLVGGAALSAMLVLAWRLGVIIDPHIEQVVSDAGNASHTGDDRPDRRNL